MINNYYKILQINPGADASTIKSAYRTLMFKQRCHPDLGGSEDEARLINEAYDTLSDPEKRNEYNKKFGPDLYKDVGSTPEERRKVPRVYINLTVEMRRKNLQPEAARIADISSLGCRLQTKDKLNDNEEIEIKIAGFIIKGKVRWKRMFHPSIFQRLYEQGIEFIKEFDDIEKIRLIDLKN